MALYSKVWYDTDYESDEEPIKVKADPYALLHQKYFTEFYYEHRLDSELIKKSSYYDYLKGKSEKAFDYFCDLEANHVALLRALKLSRAARYQFRRFIEVTYGHPSLETSASRDQAQQRSSPSTASNGTRSNSFRGKDNDNEDAATSAWGSFQGEDADGRTSTANGGAIGDGQANE